MQDIENTCGKRGEHCPPLLRKGVGAASGVGAPTFDPADWLARWAAAGGGWAGPHLLPLAGDPAALNALARELDDDSHAALREHLTVAEPTE